MPLPWFSWCGLLGLHLGTFSLFLYWDIFTDSNQAHNRWLVKQPHRKMAWLTWENTSFSRPSLFPSMCCCVPFGVFRVSDIADCSQRSKFISVHWNEVLIVLFRLYLTLLDGDTWRMSRGVSCAGLRAPKKNPYLSLGAALSAATTGPQHLIPYLS